MEGRIEAIDWMEEKEEISEIESGGSKAVPLTFQWNCGIVCATKLTLYCLLSIQHTELAPLVHFHTYILPLSCCCCPRQMDLWRQTLHTFWLSPQQKTLNFVTQSIQMMNGKHKREL